MNKIIIAVMILLTTSCSSSLIQQPVTIKELLPVGSTLRLTQALTIPKDHSSIYIAFGKVAPRKNFNTVDIYEPYCMFRLHDETADANKVLADQFKVTKVVEWEGYYSRLNYRNVASRNNRASAFRKVASMNIGSSWAGIIMHATVIGLHSNKQPEVKEIVCGHWDEQSLVEPLTLEQMKTALGDLFTIETTK